MEGIDREDTLKLYTKISTGARIAVNSLECVAKKSASLQFSGEVRRTIKEYEQIDQKAARAILTLGGKPKRISKAMRLRDWWSVSVKAFFDNSPAAMARIVLKGFDMGEDQLQGCENAYPNASEQARQLVQELFQMQDEQKSTYKRYLNA